MKNKIYIIEDDISIRRLLKDHIERYGFEVSVVEDCLVSFFC